MSYRQVFCESQCQVQGTHTAVTDWPVVDTMRTSKGGGGRLLATHTAAIWLYMGWKFCNSTAELGLACSPGISQLLLPWQLGLRLAAVIQSMLHTALQVLLQALWFILGLYTVADGVVWTGHVTSMNATCGQSTHGVLYHT